MSLQLDANGGLEFPCRYPVKAMTRASKAATEEVVRALAEAGVSPQHEKVNIRHSRNGRFQSITIEIQAHSRDELEAVYNRLQQLDAVIMTL